jgi:FkbM family methyltransferase
MNWKARIQKLSAWPLARQAHGLLLHIPVVGIALKKLTGSMVPLESRVWIQIRAGLGKGLALYLDPRFEMDYAGGKYELQVQTALLTHLKPGSVLYDVGAHIGVVSMFASGLVGSGGAIFAFEADPENAERIRAHAQRNNLSHIQVFSYAVWSSDGQVRFERASADSSRNQGSVAKLSTGPRQDVIAVESITLDSFANGHLLPTLIKVDVEGTEAEVLRGCSQIFVRSQPVVICEIHNRQAEEDVSKYLRQRNYSLKWLADSVQFPRHLLAMPPSDRSI